MSRPTVTVMMGVYNEEAHVRSAVESVLNQSFRDFELIVVDDGSTDRTPEILGSIRDPRMRVLRQSNHGPAHAYNVAVTNARAEIIAAMSGNDESMPNRLERQLEELERRGSDVLVSWVDFVDEEGKPPPPDHFAKEFFNHPHRDRPSMLHWFFYRGNYLNDITMMIRRSVYDQVGQYRPTSFELHDFDLWLRIVATREVTMLPEPLVRFRIMRGKQNISNPRTAVRSIFECFQAYRHFFDTVPSELFRQAFANELRHRDFRDGIEYELEKSFLYLGHKLELVQGVAVERLYELLQDPEILEVAMNRYDFGLPEFIDLAQRVDWTSHRHAGRRVLPAGIGEREAETVSVEPESPGSQGEPPDPEHYVFSSDAVLSDTHERYGRWGYPVPFPSVELMGTVGASDAENFLVVGDSWYNIVAKYLCDDRMHDRKEDLTVLDLGCGCGRLARFFLYRPGLQYIGLDLFRSSIEWCEEHLRPLAPSRMRFVFFDGHSEHYNPEGTIKPGTYRFPVPDCGVDLVVAASLFTHLTETDSRHYLAEVARCLGVGGRLIASILTERAGGTGYVGDEFRADFDYPYFLKLAEAAGLQFGEDLGVLCGERVIVLLRSE